MSWARLPTNKQSGFSTVEVLLAAALFGFIVIAAAGAIIYGQQSTVSSGNRVRATALAEEGIEAVRNIRDSGFANLADGTHGLAISGGQWVFSGASDTSGIYTREVEISEIDATSKLVTSTVTWPQGTGTVETSSTTRFSNWQASITPPTSWTNAILSGSLDLSGNQDAIKVATSGNYAYLVRGTGTPDFVVVDISNPSSPTLTGSLSLPDNPANIAVSGNYAYVSSSGNSTELQIVDISNPAAPSHVGSFNAPGNQNGLGVYAVGTTVYLTRESSLSEFTIINATVPTLPVQIGSYNASSNMNEVFVSGSFAYIATSDDSAELTVLNITVPALPTLAGTLNLGGTQDALTITGYGSTLLVGQGTQLHAVNVTTPGSPSLLGSVTSTGSGTVQDVTVTADTTYAFIGTSSSTAEFQVVDIATPASMSIAHTVDISGNNTLFGVSYSTDTDSVAGASSSNTQELVIFTKN